MVFTSSSTPAIYSLSLHDALPISIVDVTGDRPRVLRSGAIPIGKLRDVVPDILDVEDVGHHVEDRSEEHTSELQSQSNLVCRLLLEKKNEIDDGARLAPHA